MTLALTIQDQPNGAMQPDLTQRLTRCVFSTNLHGDEACQISAPLSMPLAFQRYDRSGLPHALISNGAETPFEGRIEDMAIRGNGIDMNAFGYQRALGDMPYTALWSSTQFGDWVPVTNDRIAGFNDRMYVMDTNNRLFIGTSKGNSYANNADVGAFYFVVPSNGGRDIVGMQFDYSMLVPTNWQFRYEQRNADFSGMSSNTLVVGSAAPQSGSIHLSFSACAMVTLLIFNSTGGVSTPAGETGANFLKITNLRIVTSTANRVNTTTTAPITAGANVTIPVVTSARMYVGQRLWLDTAPIGGVTTQSAIVTAVPSPTSVTIDNLIFTTGVGGVAVQSHIIYADEIVEDIIGDIAALNSTQLQSSITQVQSPGLDLFDERYEDELPSTVLDRLVGLGDNATPPRMWEWGLTGRKFYFRPEGDAALAWYVDASTIDVQRTIEQLINSAYAVYQDGNNRALRTTTASNTASVARYGFTRRQSVKATTTSLVQATVQRDGVIDDKASPAPRFGITFTAVYNAGGARVPIWLPRAGDTITIRNLPPTISVDIDQIRTFRIARTTCDLMTRTLTVEPATPLPTMAALIARGLRGQTT